MVFEAPTTQSCSIGNARYCRKAVEPSAEMRQRLSKEGAEPVTMTVPEFGKYIEVEIDRWAKVVKTANISLD